jgi:hypothetical protein
MLSNPKISAKKWWGVVKSIYGTKVCSTIPPRNYIYVYDPKEKAKFFNDYFVSQDTLDHRILQVNFRRTRRCPILLLILMKC